MFFIYDVCISIFHSSRLFFNFFINTRKMVPITRQASSFLVFLVCSDTRLRIKQEEEKEEEETEQQQQQTYQTTARL